MKTHNRDYFYKYVTSETAKAILKTQTLRWGSPSTFNDPFDIQIEIQASYMNDDIFYKELIEKAIELVYGEKEPIFKSIGTLGFSILIQMLRQIRHNVPVEEFRKTSISALMDGKEDAKKILENFNNDWKEYIKKSRLLCVTEEKNNLLMWAHYAQEHTGLVIELKCIEEEDTPLCVAKPIKYVDEVPEIMTKDEFINGNLGLEIVDNGRLFNNLVFTKSNHWSYEKEWRCFDESIEANSDPTGSFDTEPILAEEISAVYLGCRISQKNKSEVINILNESRYSHVKIFESFPDTKSYRLLFNQLR